MKANLLNDVLHEGDYSQFREALAAEVLREARDLHNRRKIPWLAMAASIALLVGILFYQPTEQPKIAQPPKETIHVLRTVPLKPDNILTTKPASAVLKTHSTKAFVFETKRNDTVQAISDAELLATFSHRPTALVAAEDGKRFLFLDPADSKKFMSSN